jgi:hypothetical protein
LLLRSRGSDVLEWWRIWIGRGRKRRASALTEVECPWLSFVMLCLDLSEDLMQLFADCRCSQKGFRDFLKGDGV